MQRLVFRNTSFTDKNCPLHEIELLPSSKKDWIVFFYVVKAHHALEWKN